MNLGQKIIEIKILTMMYFRNPKGDYEQMSC